MTCYDMKKMLKHPITITALSFVASLLLRVIYLTCRKSDAIHPESAAFFNGEQQGILCFWHGRLIAIPFRKPKKRRIYVLISHHADGEWIARIISFFGIRSIRGSSSKGATRALRDVLRVSKAGDNLCFTPDGPRGPRHEAASGAIWAAKTTGLPLIPIAFSASPAKVLHSWDRFVIPKPFGHIHYAAEAPITIPRNADEEAQEIAQKALQDALISLTNECDRACDLKI